MKTDLTSGYLRQVKEAFTTNPLDTNSTGQFHQYIPPTQHQGVCPSCGHCPHCGRGGYQSYPYYRQPYWGQPYWQTEVWCGNTNGAGGTVSNNLGGSYVGKL